MKFILFIFSVFFSLEAFSQIPNGSFEQWEVFLEYEKPMFWDTNQDPNYERLKKDTFSVDGEYSIKLIPGPSTDWEMCNSKALIEFKLQGPVGENKGLTFYAKSIPDSLNGNGSVFLRVHGELFVGDVYVDSYEWKIFEPIGEYVMIQIPVLNPNVDFITINLVGGAIHNGSDGCENKSYSWIDGLKISDVNIENSVFEKENEAVDAIVYPNPVTNGVVEVELLNGKEVNSYSLYSPDGVLIDQGVVTRGVINLSENLKGLFILKVVGRDFGNVVFVRILIE